MANLASNPVIAATATSAEPRPALPRAVLLDLTRAARRDDACVTVVDPDGNTQRLSLTPYRSPGQPERGPRRHAREAANVAAVQDVVTGLSARAPDLDPRALIGWAARHHPQPTTLYLITSGVSTKEPTDLRRLGWDTDGATLGALLRSGRWLPDLHGWTVRFTGIGDVAGAQPQLTDPLRERLADLWLGICRAGGAAACTIDREYVGQAAPTSTSATPVVEPPMPRVEADAAWLPASALFGMGRADVGTDADVVLQAVADRMLAADHTARIVGHTDASTGTDAVNLRLSRARAEAVRDRLVRLGVPAERIVEAIGVGSRGADPEAEKADPRLISLHRNVEIQFVNG